jgi:hypothetical protein
MRLNQSEDEEFQGNYTRNDHSLCDVKYEIFIGNILLEFLFHFHVRLFHISIFGDLCRSFVSVGVKSYLKVFRS